MKKIVLIGEEFLRLNNYIKKFKLENKIIMKGYVNDVKNWIKGAKCVISTSLWEDPGFVMIELQCAIHL